MDFLNNRLNRFKHFLRKLKFFLNEKSSEVFDRLLLFTGIKDLSLAALPNPERSIVFTGLSLNHRVVKNIKYLKQSGKYRLVILKHKGDEFDDIDRSFYDTQIIYRNKFHLKRLLASAGRFKLIYAYTSKPSYARVPIEHAGSKTIFDPYDCWIVYYGKNPEQPWMKKEIVDEEYGFANSTGILARNLESKKSMQIFHLKKKNILFSDYCDNDYFIYPDQKKTSTISLVYSGGIYGRHMLKSSHGMENFFDFIDSLKEQQIEMNIYPSPQTKPEVYYDYVEDSKKTDYLKIHPTVVQKNLSLEISKYHYGVSPQFRDESSKVSIDKLELSTSLKLFNFLEAGLPILISTELKYMAWLVERYKIGIVFTKSDIPMLSQILKSADYAAMQKNVLEVREKLSMKSNVQRMINFIENL